MKTLVQCDFDGTVTEEDASFFLLDAFAQGDWRRLLREYKEHRISVGKFNTKAFAMVKTDKPTLLEALEGKVKVRAGIHELVNYCLRKGFKLVIVSNGAFFHPEGMKVHYAGPDGKRIEDGFKEAHIKSFLKLGYGVIYIGNGASDVAPAKYAQYVFATGELLAYCRENNLNCKPFENLIDVVRDLEQISQFQL